MDMLLSVKGDIAKAKSHLVEHYFPISAYRQSHGVADQTTLILNLADTKEDSKEWVHFSVTGDTITEVAHEEFPKLLSDILSDNCTLYNRNVPNSVFPAHVVYI